MAFASIASSSSESGIEPTATQAITAPSGVTSGDLLLAFASTDSASGGLADSTGWDQLFVQATSANNHRLYCWARLADGGANDTLTLTATGSAAVNDYCAAMLRIEDHTVTDVTTDIPNSVVGPGTGHPNPPSLDAGASGDWLWIAVGVADTTTGYTLGDNPTDYTNVESETSAADTSSQLRVAYRQLAVQTEDPGQFTLTGGTRQVIAATLAIPGTTDTPPVAGFIDADFVSIAAVVANEVDIANDEATVSMADNLTIPGDNELVAEKFGIRTPEGNINATFDAFIAEFGRTPNFFRHTVSHTSAATASSNLWATFTNVNQAQYGYLWKHPTVTSSCTLPLIHGTGRTVAERNALLESTANGGEDEWWDTAFFARVAQAPAGFQHRFCLAWEPELSWAHNFRGVDITIWKAAFEYVAGRIHDAGHLVVYSGDGPFMNPDPSPPYGPVPGGGEWWEYGLPSLSSFDLFGADLYWSDTSSTISYDRFVKCQQIAYSLGKPVCFPEYGVDRDPDTSYAKSDAEVISWFTAVWDLMQSFPATGPGSLDHHCLWHTSKAGAGDWRLTPAVMAAVIERFG